MSITRRTARFTDLAEVIESDVDPGGLCVLEAAVDTVLEAMN